jgi:DENN domain-containing protein 11
VRFPCPAAFQYGLNGRIRYFIHEDYAGISAFVNVPGDASQRNAQMLAVGALVPLIYGRLGKSWRHAEGLKELAKYNR